MRPVPHQGRLPVEHVRVARPRECSVRSLPRVCQTVSGSAGYAGNRFGVRYYVNDGVLIEV